MKKTAAVLLTCALAVAMAVPASAANFTPSVTAKTAPEIVQQTTSDGSVVDAIIYDSSDSEVTGVPTGELIVTPYSDKDSADEDIQGWLDDAYDSVLNASDLSEICPDLVDILAGITDEYTIEDMVVRDLIDVTVRGTYLDYLSVDGNYITVTFDLGLATNTPLLIMVKCDYADWEALPAVQYVINEDGTVTVTFYELCAIAFIVPTDFVASADTTDTTSSDETSSTSSDSSDTTSSDSSDSDSDESVSSPQTGETANYSMLVLAVALAAAAGCCVTASVKKRRG